MGVQDLGQYIFASIRDRGWTIRQFSDKAGVQRQTLYNLRDGKTASPDLMTIVHLARALGVHPRRLTALLLKDLERKPISTVHAKDRPPLYPGDASLFVQDVTIPDYEIVFPGERFEKKWAIQNMGTVTWEGRRLVCLNGDVSEGGRFEPLRPDSRELEVPVTRPGETVVLSMMFTAPARPGDVKSYWKMFDAEDRPCFPGLDGIYCVVTVVDF